MSSGDKQHPISNHTSGTQGSLAPYPPSWLAVQAQQLTTPVEPELRELRETQRGRDLALGLEGAGLLGPSLLQH